MTSNENTPPGETPDTRPPTTATEGAAAHEVDNAAHPTAGSTSATAELAAILERPDSLSAEDLKEDRIELESERSDAKIDPLVIVPALVAVLGVVVWGLAGPDSFGTAADAAFTWVLDNLGWAFILFGTVFVAFILIIALGRFGSIRLGGIDEQPEFRTSSWIAMMFAAGMGIGLMFYGASEPLAFYLEGVPGRGAGDVGAAMATAMYHWTLHPWAIYAIVGLAIAYSTFRVGRKQLISAAFTPLVGERAANGAFGKIIDSLSIFATVFGTACSLGLGALQIRSGLEASGFVENPGMGLIVGIVAVLTGCFLLSALSGVSRGIQLLSNVNMVLAGFLAIFVFVAGPTVTQLNLIPGAIGAYLDQFFEMAGRTASSGGEGASEWLSSWTIFYGAWWISWSPFVGMFLARISRGRSIKEFCLGVMLVPAGLSTVWFAIMGGSAILLEQRGESIVGGGTTEEQLFNLLQSLPLGGIASIVGVVLLGTFFMTSADSASTVMGSMSQNGRSDAHPWLSALWGLLTALVGLTLLIAGGDDALNAVQNVTIVAATPFLFVLIGLMFAIVKGLRQDVIYLDQREQERFGRQLALERRLHRERREREEQQDRLRRMIPGRGTERTPRR